MTRWFPRLLLVTFLLQTAIYAIRPIVSYRAISVGADTFDLGVIASSFAALSLLVAVPIGRWVDRWGEPWFVISGAAIISVACVSLVWLGTVWSLALSQAALGLGHIMSVVGTQTLIANASSPERREKRFGIFTVVVSLGQLVGPAAAGLLAGGSLNADSGESSQASYGTAVVFAAAGAATGLGCLVAVTLWLRPDDRGRYQSMEGREERTAAPMRALGRVLAVPSMPQAMLASLAVLTSIDILAAYLPAYGEANGMSVQTVGFLLAVRAAASMAVRLVMVPLIVLLHRRPLLVLSMLLPAVALATFPFLDQRPLHYLAMIVIGFGLGLGQPITLAWVAGQAPTEVRGTAIGVRLTGNRLGQTVLPLIVGGIAGATGVAAMFFCLSAILTLSSAFVLRGSFEGRS